MNRSEASERSDGLRARLEAIQDKGLIYPRDGAICVEAIVHSRYPDIDVDLLCDLLADTLFDWSAAINDYVRWPWDRAWKKKNRAKIRAYERQYRRRPTRRAWRRAYMRRYMRQYRQRKKEAS